MPNMTKSDKYLLWLATRRAKAEVRLAAMQPIVPVETPLLQLLKTAR